MKRMREVGGAAAALVAATLVALALRTWLGIENLSSVYLLSVAAAALLAGTALAVATAVGAFLLYNFLFLEPRFTLAVTEPQSLLTLLLLLVIGLIVGRLTSFARDRATESTRREREARALFSVTRVLATAPRTDQALPAIADRIAVETEIDRVWIGLGVAPTPERIVADTESNAPSPTSNQPAVLRRDSDEGSARWIRIHRQGPHATHAGSGSVYRVDIATGDERFGALYALRANGSGNPTKETSRLLAAAADQIAQALRRDQLARRALDVEVAERSDAAKSALLDLVSHELRTPLATIRASAGSLADPSLALGSTERQGLAEAIDNEAMRLNRLVGNLLDMSRLQDGRVSPDIELIPVQDAVEGVLERLRPALAGRSVDVSIPVALPPVLADATFLEQVLTNLLENAARYSPRDAPIRVQAAASSGMVELCVEDGGAGVPDGQLVAIFDRFFRGDSAQKHPGTGLGLALVRGLVEAMSGDVSARRSRLGGLSVTVHLPAAGRAG